MLIVFVDISDGTDEGQYDFVLSNFKPDKLYVKCRRNHHPSSRVFKNATLIESVDDITEDYPLILLLPLQARYITPTIALNNFTHPTDAIYMFGPNHEHLSYEDFPNRQPDHIVYIPTDTNDDMYSYNSYAITMWDRAHG